MEYLKFIKEMDMFSAFHYFINVINYKKYLEDKLKAAEMQVEKTKTVFEYSTKNKVTQEEIERKIIELK